MDTKVGMLLVVGICVMVLLIGFLRRKAELILNFLVRSVLGTMGIYLINMILGQLGVAVSVGINAISVLTVGTLGTGGIGLLYGIVFYNLL